MKESVDDLSKDKSSIKGLNPSDYELVLDSLELSPIIKAKIQYAIDDLPDQFLYLLDSVIFIPYTKTLSSDNMVMGFISKEQWQNRHLDKDKVPKGRISIDMKEGCTYEPKLYEGKNFILFDLKTVLDDSIQDIQEHIIHELGHYYYSIKTNKAKCRRIIDTLPDSEYEKLKKFVCNNYNYKISSDDWYDEMFSYNLSNRRI